MSAIVGPRGARYIGQMADAARAGGRADVL